MYNKVLNYFERTYCVENIYFRKNWKLWIFGWIIVFSLCIAIENLIELFGFSYSFLRTIIIDFVLMIPFLILNIANIYKTLKEIYEIKEKGRIDFLSLLTRETVDSYIFNKQLDGMKQYLKELNVLNRQSIEDIVSIAQKEVKEKYPKKDWLEQFFSKITPIIIFILTIFFTNNNIKDFNNIVSITIAGIVSAFVIYYFFSGFRNINITPVSKRNNLLDFIEIMENLKIEIK